jgi:hypothetical protein
MLQGPLEIQGEFIREHEIYWLVIFVFIVIVWYLVTICWICCFFQNDFRPEKCFSIIWHKLSLRENYLQTISFFFLYFCDGRGYIGAFTQVNKPLLNKHHSTSFNHGWIKHHIKCNQMVIPHCFWRKIHLCYIHFYLFKDNYVPVKAHLTRAYSFCFLQSLLSLHSASCQEVLFYLFYCVSKRNQIVKLFYINKAK